MRTILTVAAVLLASMTLTGSTSQAAGQVGQRVLLMGSSTTGCAGPSSPARCYGNLLKAARPADSFTVLARGGTYIGYGTPAQNWTATPIPGGHDVVVIQLGINDWYVPVQPATLRQQIDRLVGRVKAANPGARIGWLRTWMPVPTGNAVDRLRWWALHGQVAADAMFYARQDGSDATFLDMGTSPQPRRSAKVGDNGWHYNDRGHTELADAVLNWLL
jgi:lysophospholipase L1-like esterase